MIKESVYKEIYKYIEVFLLIYATDTFIVFSNSTKTVRSIFQIIILVIVFISLIIKRDINKKIIIYIFLLTLPVIFSMIVNNDYSNGNMAKIFMLISGAIISNTLGFKEYQNMFTKVMYVIASFSLVTYMMSGFILEHRSMFPILTNTSGTSVVYLFLSNIVISNDIPRNYGPFWEPGVYAIYLNIALMFALNTGKKPKVLDYILMITILTTLSTTGVIVFLLNIIDFAYIQRTNEDSSKALKQVRRGVKIGFTLFLFSIIFLIFINENVYDMLFSKFDKTDYRYLSTLARMNSISGNIKIWLENPIFGVGAIKISNAFYEYCNGYAASNTNGLLMHFSMYGVFEGFTLIICLLRLSKNIKKNNISRLLVFTIFIIILISEPLITSILLNILIFYGIDHYKENNRKKDLCLNSGAPYENCAN